MTHFGLKNGNPEFRIPWFLAAILPALFLVSMASFCESSQRKVTLAVDIGRIRSEPALDAEVKFRLKGGASPSVIDKKGEWYLIQLKDGRTGWAHQSLFFPEEPAQIPVTPEQAEIKEIEFIETPEGEEVVTFLLNGYYPPKTFSNTVNGPKLICEFSDVRLGNDIRRVLNTDGNFIKQVRIGIIKGANPRIKVIVDLVPLKKYDIRPVFFKDQNLFSIIVQKGQ